MDPLFGFMDELSVVITPQQQEQIRAALGGEYTISFPVNYAQTSAPQPGRSEPHQLHLNNSNSATPANVAVSTPTPSSSGASADPLSLPETSQNDKPVYVIKLENILGDNQGEESGVVRPPENITDNAFIMPHHHPEISEAPFAEAATGENSSDEDVADFTSKSYDVGGSTEAQSPDPFLVMSPEAIMAMAQSTGVELNEEVASELGCLVMNKLRHTVLMALQFSQNENSEGIQVEHFAKAEEQLESPSLGHQSVFRETAYKYAGGVSILDDGPEIDLYASIRQSNMTEVPIDDADPILNVHHALSHELTSMESHKNKESSNFKLYDQPLVQHCSKVGCGNEKESLNAQQTSVNGLNSSSGSQKNCTRDKNSATVKARKSKAAAGNADSVKAKFSENKTGVGEDESSEEETENENFANEFMKITNNLVEGEITNDCKSKSGAMELDQVSQEWKSYIELLMEQIVSSENSEREKQGRNPDLKKILQDIRLNGMHPVFNVVCDSFRDYLREDTISRGTIFNILSVVDALVCSRCEPSLMQMTDLGGVLIEIMILPPPCEVHPFLSSVFMKILKNCNELLTWTCTYVTEILKGISETSLNELLESLKCSMHGALCLANGLEELKIQVAQEFGWHSSVLNFSRYHFAIFDGQGYEPTPEDSYLEEEIMKFYHNFLNNYTSLVSPLELSQVRDLVISLYGERFPSFASNFAPPTATTQRIAASGVGPVKNVSNKKTQCVFRKINYKNKEIVIPCRRIVK